MNEKQEELEKFIKGITPFKHRDNAVEFDAVGAVHFRNLAKLALELLADAPVQQPRPTGHAFKSGALCRQWLEHTKLHSGDVADPDTARSYMRAVHWSYSDRAAILGIRQADAADYSEIHLAMVERFVAGYMGEK